jgi:hypothetical protein
MRKKLTDPKMIEKLSLLAVAKTGPDENIAAITKKVISDYFGAKDAFKEYNDSILSPKATLKLLEDKKQEKKSKPKIKAKAKAAGE